MADAEPGGSAEPISSKGYRHTLCGQISPNPACLAINFQQIEVKINESCWIYASECVT